MLAIAKREEQGTGHRERRSRFRVTGTQQVHSGVWAAKLPGWAVSCASWCQRFDRTRGPTYLASCFHGPARGVSSFWPLSSLLEYAGPDRDEEQRESGQDRGRGEWDA